jgi:DtxR family Mn-dependent transcriptional regulator
LRFSWEEVHEVAEELEHVRSKKLIDKLDAFLSHPSLTRMVTRYPTITAD